MATQITCDRCKKVIPPHPEGEGYSNLYQACYPVRPGKFLLNSTNPGSGNQSQPLDLCGKCVNELRLFISTNPERDKVREAICEYGDDHVEVPFELSKKNAEHLLEAAGQGREVWH